MSAALFGFGDRLKRSMYEFMPLIDWAYQRKGFAMIDRGMLDYVMERIRPQLQADGGDVEITEINDEEGIVYVALQGACVGCPMSSLTISQGSERVLKEHVPGVERVLPDLSAQDFADQEVKVAVLDDEGNVVGEKSVSPEELFNK